MHLLARSAPTMHLRHHAEVFEKSIGMCGHLPGVRRVGQHIGFKRHDLLRYLNSRRGCFDGGVNRDNVGSRFRSNTRGAGGTGQ